MGYGCFVYNYLLQVLISLIGDKGKQGLFIPILFTSIDFQIIHSTPTSAY